MDSFPDTGWKDRGLPCLVKEAPERQAREREGGGERDGRRKLQGRGSECVWIRAVHRASACTGGDPNRIRESEAKAAGQRIVFICFDCYLGEYETATARETRDRQTCRGGGAQTDGYPSGGGPESDRRNG